MAFVVSPEVSSETREDEELRVLEGRFVSASEGGFVVAGEEGEEAEAWRCEAEGCVRVMKW